MDAISTQRAIDQQAGRGGVGPSVPPVDGKKKKEDWFSQYKWWLLGGAVGFGVLSTMGASKGSSAARKAARGSTIASALPVLLLVGGGLFLVGNISGGVGVSKFLSGLEGR